MCLFKSYPQSSIYGYGQPCKTNQVKLLALKLQNLGLKIVLNRLALPLASNQEKSGVWFKYLILDSSLDLGLVAFLLGTFFPYYLHVKLTKGALCRTWLKEIIMGLYHLNGDWKILMTNTRLQLDLEDLCFMIVRLLEFKRPMDVAKQPIKIVHPRPGVAKFSIACH